MKDKTPIRALTALILGICMIGLMGLAVVGLMDPGDWRGVARLGALVALSAAVFLGMLVAAAATVTRGHPSS